MPEGPHSKANPVVVGVLAACIVPLAVVLVTLRWTGREDTLYDVICGWLIDGMWGWAGKGGRIVEGALWVIGEAFVLYVVVDAIFGSRLSWDEVQRYRRGVMTGFILARPVVAVVTFFLWFAITFVRG